MRQVKSLNTTGNIVQAFGAVKANNASRVGTLLSGMNTASLFSVAQRRGTPLQDVAVVIWFSPDTAHGSHLWQHSFP